MLIKDINAKAVEPCCPTEEDLQYLCEKLNNSIDSKNCHVSLEHHPSHKEGEEDVHLRRKLQQMDFNNDLNDLSKVSDKQFKDEKTLSKELWGKPAKDQCEKNNLMESDSRASPKEEAPVRCSKKQRRVRRLKKGASIICWTLFCPIMLCAMCLLTSPDYEDEDDYCDDPIMWWNYKTDFVASYKRQ